MRTINVFVGNYDFVVTRDASRNLSHLRAL
jgi:hypothetical protein